MSQVTVTVFSDGDATSAWYNYDGGVRLMLMFQHPVHRQESNPATRHMKWRCLTNWWEERRDFSKVSNMRREVWCTSSSSSRWQIFIRMLRDIWTMRRSWIGRITHPFICLVYSATVWGDHHRYLKVGFDKWTDSGKWVRHTCASNCSLICSFVLISDKS